MKKNSIALTSYLDSNWVWYSSFWSEGPKNNLTLKFLV